MNEAMVQKLTPDAAERLIMMEALLGAGTRALESVKPKRGEWPMVGEEVFVKREAFGADINKVLMFAGSLTTAVHEGRYLLVGTFIDISNGMHQLVKEWDFEYSE
jgi:hypothetical protein